MGAVAVHHTATVDVKWNGPGNEAKLKADQPAEYYARAFAWRDPEGDPRLKQTWKFPHHEVDEDGNPGAANMNAAMSGCGVLNGARGGTKIPDSDRMGVWRHLAAHLRDGDMEPPELKAESELEMKSWSMKINAIGERSGRFQGMASLFGVTDLSNDIVEQGAFAKSIKDSSTVPVLWQHDPSMVIGSAEVAETKRGLLVSGTLDMDDPDATKALRKMINGLVKGLSIGYQAVRSKFAENGARILQEVKLWEVSVVTFPMLPSAQISSVKSLADKQRVFGDTQVEQTGAPSDTAAGGDPTAQTAAPATGPRRDEHLGLPATTVRSMAAMFNRSTNREAK